MNTRSCNRSAALVTAFAAAGMMSSIASAAGMPDAEVLKEIVRYDDLNLNRLEDITTLYHRVHGAAVQVCAPMESRELARMLAWKNCIGGAISRAVAQINVPALTEHAETRG